MAISFGWFGTLVEIDRPAEPAAAVARELAARDVSVPDDWDEVYTETHVDAPEGAEVPLPARVGAALASRDVAWEGNAVRRAVVAAFDPDVRTREGALEAVAAARERGPVAICANCDVPELFSRTLVRSDLELERFDATVTSVGCGWRKPAPEIFELTADRLGADPVELVHVGANPEADGGGIERVGGTAISLEETPLAELPAELAALYR